jgi:hypothetical protein
MFMHIRSKSKRSGRVGTGTDAVAKKEPPEGGSSLSLETPWKVSDMAGKMPWQML